MTALTVLRTDFQRTADRPTGAIMGRRITTQQQHRTRQRIIEEPHPEVLMNLEKQKEKLRHKAPSLPATIEDASEDDEKLATTSGCSSLSGTQEGRSPHVLPPQERFWCYPPTNQALLLHPLISPKLGRRLVTSSIRTTTVNPIITGAQQEIIVPVMRRKRSLSSIGERLSGVSFYSAADFLNLPPIPESVPVRKTLERKGANSVEEEDEEEDEETNEKEEDSDEIAISKSSAFA